MSVKKYNPLAMLFHWAMAIGIFAAVGLAWTMTDIPGITPTKLKLYNWHKWLGVSLFVAVGLRLIWRQLAPPPRLPSSISDRDQRLAHWGHVGLYVLMFAVPIGGYLYSLAAGYPVVWFGVIELPVLIAPNPELKPLLKEAHELGGNAMLALVGVHVLAALKHHVFDKDEVLARMVPFLSKPKG